MPNLRSKLADLAASFADSVVDAIRSASLHELLQETSHPRAHRVDAKAFGAARSGRLPRRSADEIVAVLDEIVGLVSKHKDGLRAEQIRSELGLQAKELPRVLKEGLMTKRLRSKGQKRATTYFAK
jgi:hypothetical protein